jgi:bacterial/archaeal transporter family protein
LSARDDFGIGVVAYPEAMTWLIWALLSALFAAATAILAKVGVAGIDSNLATAVRTTVVLVFTWAIAFSLGRHNAIGQISPRSWVFLVLSGLATGLSWLCYFRALQLGPASAVAPIDKLSVVLVILFAWLFLGEGLTIHKMIGGLLIAGGAATLVFG